MKAGEVTFGVRRGVSELTVKELLDLYDTTPSETKWPLRAEIERRMNKPPQYVSQMQQFAGWGNGVHP